MKKINNIFLLLLFTCLIYYSYNIFLENKAMKNTITVDKLLNEKNGLAYFKEKINNNIVASLSINDTNLNTVIVKGKDNTYYLNHDINNKYNPSGSVFMDYNDNIDSKIIRLYGHMNTNKNIPFTELKKYLNKDFYQKHQVLIFNDIQFKIFAVAKFNQNNYNLTINNVIKNSLFHDAYKDSQFIILQTCFPNEKNTYLIISAYKI